MEYIGVFKCEKCATGVASMPIRVTKDHDGSIVFEEIIEVVPCEQCGNDDEGKFELLDIFAQ
jgi:hypothetical protein